VLSTVQRDRSLSADLLGAVVFDGLIKARVRLFGCFAAEYKPMRRTKKLDDRVLKRLSAEKTHFAAVVFAQAGVGFKQGGLREIGNKLTRLNGFGFGAANHDVGLWREYACQLPCLMLTSRLD